MTRFALQLAVAVILACATPWVHAAAPLRVAAYDSTHFKPMIYYENGTFLGKRM